ncbi:MAG: HAMP domain-containing sensor histidine kinase [Pseudomonadota bacterium]
MSHVKAALKLSAIRQALWLLAVFLGITLVTWGATYWLVQREMMVAVDGRLSERMALAIAALDAGQPLPEPGDGETAQFKTGTERDGFRTVDKEPPGPEMRYLVQITDHGRIQLGENTERQEELRDILTAGMQVTLFTALITTILAGLWMARRAQARVNRISSGLGEIAQGNLGTRIKLSGDDDLSQLAERINATTARLENAVTQMRVQSSNIAHDLRTPLARLRASLEISLIEATDQNRTVEPEVLTEALYQIDEINATFEALLRLARIEGGAGREAFKAVALGALVADIAETFGPVVEDAGHALATEVTEPATVLGDQKLLVQLVGNLIQNALQYGADNQQIELQVQGGLIRISDQGPGIPAPEREKVLQPLYQGEQTRQGKGFGLGLSLVRAIAELHDATLTLGDRRDGPGLMVEVEFPQLTRPPAKKPG